MQKLYITSVSQNGSNYNLGIKVPESTDKDSTEGFAMGVDFVLQAFEANPRLQNQIIQTLRDSDIIQVLD